jgi:hypothetical protein
MISPSCAMCRVSLARTDVSEESFISIIKVTEIGKLGKTLAITSNRSILHASVASNCQRYS